MPITITRTDTNLIGSAGTPATIAAAGSASGTLDLTSPAGVLQGTILVVLIFGASAPSTNPTVQFAFSLDGGTTYNSDGAAVSVTPISSSTIDVGPYQPPDPASKAQVTITNGATNPITAYAQGATEAVS